MPQSCVCLGEVAGKEREDLEKLAWVVPVVVSSPSSNAALL